MKRCIVACGVLLLALIVVAPEAGAVQGGSRIVGASRVRVRIVDSGTSGRFRPASVTIARGTVVKWVNRDSQDHTSTGGSWDSGIISPGDSFRKRFRHRGTFAYSCTIHPSMMGSITVT